MEKNENSLNKEKPKKGLGAFFLMNENEEVKDILSVKMPIKSKEDIFSEYERLNEMNEVQKVVRIITDKMETQLENDVLKVIQRYGIDIDRDRLIRLLKKENEVKPILRQSPSWLGKLLGEEATYTCPCCGNARLTKMANERQNNNYCWVCGQKLDWSDIE